MLPPRDDELVDDEFLFDDDCRDDDDVDVVPVVEPLMPAPLSKLHCCAN